jgi:hypothetical protein
MTETYETHAKGIRILPGQWRPHYRFEQIAWVSPPWPSQDYIYLDFPEAICSSLGFLYLSHVNPPIPTIFKDLPAVPWQSADNRLSFERRLPNDVVFGGSLATNGRYRLGWRGGPEITDLPVLVTVSEQESRLVGMTWHEHTLSLIGNPHHPCMHADPFFPDLQPGEKAGIQGELLFFEGSLACFETWFRQRRGGQPGAAADGDKPRC